MKAAPVCIPDSLTGQGDTYILRSSVLAIYGGYNFVILTLSGGKRLEFHPPFVSKEESIQLQLKIRALLLTPEELDQAAAIGYFNTGIVNPSNVRGLHFRAGCIWVEMEDGTEFNSRTATFDNFRASFAALYGKDAAAQLKPAEPSKAVYQPKGDAEPLPKPKPQPVYKPPTNAEEFMAMQARNAEPELPVYRAPAVSGPAAVMGVVHKMELDLLQLMGVGEYADGASVCDSRLQSLRRAAVEYQNHTTADTAGAVVRAAQRVTEVACRLPQTHTTARFRENARSLADMPVAA